MGQINIWIKGAFITVCLLIGIISSLLLAITLFGHGYAHQTEEIEELLPTISVVYVIGGGTLALTIIGAYGACKKKKWAVFLVSLPGYSSNKVSVCTQKFSLGMTVGSLYLLAESISAYQMKEEIKEEIREHYKILMPLTNPSEKDLGRIHKIQNNFKCCGVENGYKDWGDEIPISCLCSEDNRAFKCVDSGNNTRFIVHHSSNNMSEEDHGLTKEHRLVYAEPCIPVLINSFNFVIDLILGICFAVTLLWAVGASLSITILCQMRRKLNVPPVMFTSKVSQYTQLSDPAANA
ncbi:tetraspanin-8 isoform X1 [Esox lucius]|uniref:Tetraspanin n=1 Tax=Esox lucius TaxID=8010 RepID=A0A3P8ZTS7_ESOLU|nr:tetraspanin-8 isoform X1 [Esox lucius]